MCRISESVWYHLRFSISLFIYNFSLSLGHARRFRPRIAPRKILNDILQHYYWHTCQTNPTDCRRHHGLASVVPIESYRHTYAHVCAAHPGRDCVRVIHSRSLPFCTAKGARLTNRYFHWYSRELARCIPGKFHNYVTESTIKTHVGCDWQISPWNYWRLCCRLVDRAGIDCGINVMVELLIINDSWNESPGRLVIAHSRLFKFARNDQARYRTRIGAHYSLLHNASLEDIAVLHFNGRQISKKLFYLLRYLCRIMFDVSYLYVEAYLLEATDKKNHCLDIISERLSKIIKKSLMWRLTN